MRIAVSIALLGLLSASGSCAPLTVVTARLLGRLDSRHTSTGAPFFVKTISEWKQGRCSLPIGTTLEGRVDKIVMRSPDTKRDEISLRLLPRPCPTDDSQQVFPLLVAIRLSGKDSNDDTLARQELMTAFASVAGSHTPMGAGGGAVSSPRPGLMGGVGGGFSPLPTQDSIRAGEVRGYPSVKLILPHLTSDPTILTGNGELLFDPDARFVLVVHLEPARVSTSIMTASASTTPPAPTSAPAATVAHHQASAPAAEPVLVEDCVSGGCVAAANSAGLSEQKATLLIPLRNLSYRPRLGRRVQGGLEDESAISFLGNDQIFATFNAHTLVPRTQVEALRSITPRQIRGVLVSTRTGRSLRVVDWVVPDDGPYLWPLDRNRILVHIGSSLIVYGSDLREEARWSIPGSLAFVTLSPSHQSILLAVKHDSYDAATFQRLADFIGSANEVQEECELIALDDNLQQTASHHLTGTPMRPAILDSGMISAVNDSGTRWKIDLNDWGGHRHQLARLASGCTPTMQTLPGNLLFLSGCKSGSSSKWYRVLRSNGKTLLRGETGNDAIPEYAVASPSGDRFAIGVELANEPVDWNTGMSIASLETMAVSVYQTANGHLIYGTKLSSHSIDRSSLALSASGDKLAIIDDSSLRIYPLPPA